MRRVLGLGAGGHAAVIIEMLQDISDLTLVGLLDPKLASCNLPEGVAILGGDERLEALFNDGVGLAFNGVGGFGDGAPHRRVFERGKAAGFSFLTVVHASAVISRSARIGEGSVIFAQAVVNTGAQLGCNVIINTGASVDHHCVVGDHAHLAPGVRLAGGVTIGEGAQLGLGAVVREGVSVGPGALVGAGAVVLSDVPAGMLAIGVPAEFRIRTL